MQRKSLALMEFNSRVNLGKRSVLTSLIKKLYFSRAGAQHFPGFVVVMDGERSSSPLKKWKEGGQVQVFGLRFP